jgi:pimeloyl-ACP methyl ester carboxylesterase
MRSDVSTAQDTLAPESGRRPPAPVRAEERELVFEGYRYRCRVVRREGARTAPLLVLGGSSQNRCAWVRHEKWLAPLFTMVTVDLPGYGAADFLPATHGLDFLAANVRHLLTELSMPEVNLLGVCFGGAIALRFAQHYPEHLVALGLVGMTKAVPDDYADAVPRWTRMLERGARAEIATELVRRFMSPPGFGPVRKHEIVSRLLYAQFMGQSPEELRMSVEHNDRLLSHDWYRDEPLPAVPSLVFTGEYDTLCTPDMGREVAALLPGSTFTTLKEADHLVPLERMAEFSELTAAFFTRQPLTGLPYCNALEALGDGAGPRGVPAPAAEAPVSA